MPEGLAGYFQIFARGLMFDVAAAVFALTPFVLLARAHARLACAHPGCTGRWWCPRSSQAPSRYWCCRSPSGPVLGRVRRPASTSSQWTTCSIRTRSSETSGRGYPVGRILAALALLALSITALPPRAALWQAGRRTARLGALPARWSSPTASRWPAPTASSTATTRAHSAQDAANELAGNGLYEFFFRNRRQRAELRSATTRRCRSRRRWPGARLVPGRRVGRAGARRAWSAMCVATGAGAQAERGSRDGGKAWAPNSWAPTANAGGLTPNLDSLARESLWFSNVYATGNRTVARAGGGWRSRCRPRRASRSCAGRTKRRAVLARQCVRGQGLTACCSPMAATAISTT